MSQNWNLASLGALAYGSGHYAGAPVTNTIDGNATTWYTTAGTPVTAVECHFDLGVPRLIDTIRLAQNVNAGQSATAVNVYSSSNGVDWTLIANYAISTGDTTFLITPTAARWFKIVPTAGWGGRWSMNTVELVGVEASVPVVTDIGAWIQWVWDNAYQQAFDFLEATFPTWDFDPMDAWHIAMGATCVSLCAQILDKVGGGEVDLTPVLEAIGSYGGLTLHERHTTTQTLVGNVHAQVLDTQADIIGQFSVSEGNINANTTAEFVNHRTWLGTADPAGSGRLDALAAQIAAIGTPDLSEVLADLASILGKLGEYGESETVHTLLDTITTVATSVQTISGDLHTDLGVVDTVVDQVLSAVLGLSIPQATAAGYPGPSGVTFGSSTNFVGSVSITAAATGPGGKMDGVILDWTSVPPSKGRQQVQGITNYKFLGWLVFLSPDGKCDEIQWLGPQSRAYLPKQLTSPGSVVVSARDAAAGSIRPWVLT